MFLELKKEAENEVALDNLSEFFGTSKKKIVDDDEFRKLFQQLKEIPLPKKRHVRSTNSKDGGCGW